MAKDRTERPIDLSEVKAAIRKWNKLTAIRAEANHYRADLPTTTDQPDGVEIMTACTNRSAGAVGARAPSALVIAKAIESTVRQRGIRPNENKMSYRERKRAWQLIERLKLWKAG
jgi:hypothetical protein